MDTQWAAVNESLLLRTGLLVAKDEIRDVIMRYSRGVDRRDRELLASVFHDDAIARLGEHTVRGDRVVDTLYASASRFSAPGWHLIGNVTIDVDDKVAYSESYFMAVQTLVRDDKELTRFRAGRYVDRFEYRDEWRIAEHVIVDDWSRVDALAERWIANPKYPGALAPDDVVYRIRSSEPVDEG